MTRRRDKETDKATLLEVFLLFLRLSSYDGDFLFPVERFKDCSFILQMFAPSLSLWWGTPIDLPRCNTAFANQ